MVGVIVIVYSKQTIFIEKSLFLFLIGRKLLCNVLLVSALQQRESVIIMYIIFSLVSLPPTLTSPHPRSSQNAGLGSLCHTATSHYFTRDTIYIYNQRYLLNSSHPHLPPLCPQVCYLLGLSVPFFWIPHICVNIWYLFFSFWFTSLCLRGSRFIHSLQLTQ